jgi:hypothetical protein
MLNKDKNVVLSILGSDRPAPKHPLMVTIRTDERLWELFGEYAKEKGKDRSKLLNEFIRLCVSETNA